MSRSVPISVAILLAACGVAATSNDAANSAAQRSRPKARPQPPLDDLHFDRGGMAGCFDPRLSGFARAAAERIGGVPCDEAPGATGSGGDAWIGEYRGPAVEGMNGTVSITPGRGPGRYAVGIVVSGPGCAGSVDGTATVANNRMTLIAPVPDQSEQCRIHLDRNGSTLVVEEVENCLYFHGAQCRFDARVTRQRSARAAPRPNAPARQASWLVGAWVNRGAECGGEGWVVSADGSYSDVEDNGRWALAGNTLTITALRQAVPGGELGEDTLVRNPRPTRAQIIARTPRSFSMRHPNGFVTHWTRCR